jgi:hypothetical protein
MGANNAQISNHKIAVFVMNSITLLIKFVQTLARTNIIQMTSLGLVKIALLTVCVVLMAFPALCAYRITLGT